jgi:hypothetical protein
MLRGEFHSSIEKHGDPVLLFCVGEKEEVEKLLRFIIRITRTTELSLCPGPHLFIINLVLIVNSI